MVIVTKAATNLGVQYQERQVPRANGRKRRWPHELDRVRQALPAHLLDPPPVWPGSWLLVATSDKRPIGYLWAQVLQTELVYVEEVAVLPERQGLGVGTGLLVEFRRRLHRTGGGCKELMMFPIFEREGWVRRAGFTRLPDSYRALC